MTGPRVVGRETRAEPCGRCDFGRSSGLVTAYLLLCPFFQLLHGRQHVVASLFKQGEHGQDRCA